MARTGFESGEAPRGVLVVSACGGVIGRCHNTIIATGNTTMHAEMKGFANGGEWFDDTDDMWIVSTLDP